MSAQEILSEEIGPKTTAGGMRHFTGALRAPVARRNRAGCRPPS